MRPGDVVLDVGAGSGVLSMFAARAGAARVYAVEQTSMAVLAQELVAANGLSDVIEVIQDDVMDIEPPERVDVIVSGMARWIRDRRRDARSGHRRP